MTIDNFLIFMSGVLLGGIGIMLLHHVRPLTRWDRLLTGKRKWKLDE